MVVTYSSRFVMFSTWWYAARLLTLVVLWLGCYVGESSATDTRLNIGSAIISYTYKDPETGRLESTVGELGRYGLTSRLDPEYGHVVHIRTSDNEHHGCTPVSNVPIRGPWVALIQRGGCKFHTKIHNAVVLSNASAVVVYNNIEDDEHITMDHNVEDVVAVFIHKKDGERLAELADSGIDVMMNITVGTVMMYVVNDTGEFTLMKVKNAPILIVSLMFVILLIFGLTGLLIYTVRRSKYVREKNRAQAVFTLQDTTQAQENLLTSESQEPHDAHDMT